MQLLRSKLKCQDAIAQMCSTVERSKTNGNEVNRQEY